MSAKIALQCQSRLLQQSLEKFLKGQIVPIDSAQLVITDHPLKIDKPTLLIGIDENSDLKKPFSRSQLLLKLEEKLAQTSTFTAMQALKEDENPPSLEEKIADIMKRYTKEVIDTVKEHYEDQNQSLY